MTLYTSEPVASHANWPICPVELRRTRDWPSFARGDLLLLALALLIAMAGIGEGDVLTNDFTPCWGAPQGPAITPAVGRALIATSSNGMDFQRPTDPELALVVDRIGVPDAVVLPSGRILLYFVAGCKYYDGAEHKTDEIAVGVSDTNGSDWVFKNVEFTGVPGDLSRAVDPNVVLLPGGELSLFGTMWVEHDSRSRIYSFLSTDGGFTYAFNGLRYDPAGSPDGVLDPENYRFSDTSWEILTGGECGHGLSTDGGNTFTCLGRFTDAAVVHEVSVTDFPGTYRAYSPGDGRAIKSYHADTAPWTTWTQEPGERLTLDTTSTMESCEVVFPTVVKTASAGYLMFYQTTIPGCSCPGEDIVCALKCSASAAPEGGGAPLQVQFTGTTNAVGWDPVPAYSWSFGDGGTSTEASPQHTYTAAGTYDWTLTATAGTETCTSSGTVTVVPCTLSCSATVTPSTGERPLSVQFSATAAADTCAGAPSFAWSTGDGATSTEASYAHVYTQSGEFSWTLAVTMGDKTCTRSGSVTVAVPGRPLRRTLRMKPATPAP